MSAYLKRYDYILIQQFDNNKIPVGIEGEIVDGSDEGAGDHHAHRDSNTERSADTAIALFDFISLSVVSELKCLPHFKKVLLSSDDANEWKNASSIAWKS